MDAYDIFKKLTRGLTFKKKVLGTKKEDTKKSPEPLKKKHHLKKEKAKALETHGVGDKRSENHSSSESSDNDMELVEGVKVGKKRKKKKKERTVDLQKKLELEEQNRFRNEHGIKVVGRHVPPALASFTSLTERYGVSPKVVETVLRCGYTEPTPVQRQTIPCMLEDRQLLACAPTGSGKTAAFLLPVIHSLGTPQGGPRALLLCPTRELAQQTYREALRLTEPTELRVSVLRSLKESKVKEREATFRKSDIVISTPNRLCYLLNQDKVNISLDKVRWLIIDEADKLFEGSAEQLSDFRQQLDQIMAACDHKQRRVAMFSATHTPNVAKWCRHNLRGLINVTVGHRNAASELVDQELLFCGSEAGKLVAFRQLVQDGLKPPVLVFVQSKERAKELFKELIYDGINVDVIHADRTQAQRDNVVRSFRVGRIWVLICTELMGRGIDFRGVNLVINYDFPPDAIAYVHRVGRAGRAGQKGKAITFFTEDDFANLRSIASVIRASGCPVPDYMLRMKQNANRRRALARKAPRRDRISTLVLAPSKRKLDESKESSNPTSTNKATALVKTSKHTKLRRIQPQTSPDNIHNKKLKKMPSKSSGDNIKQKKLKSFKSFSVNSKKYKHKSGNGKENKSGKKKNLKNKHEKFDVK